MVWILDVSFAANGNQVDDQFSMLSVTHIFYVEVEDFVHEGGGEGDDHSVTPRLAKGPDYDHPDCPSKVTFNVICDPLKFEQNVTMPHLLPSMSLISGKTFPCSCFSLTAGSNVRFSRISFLSWGTKSGLIPNLIVVDISSTNYVVIHLK